MPRVGTVHVDSVELGALSAELLNSGVAVRLRVRGASMRPFICDGDEVTLEQVGPDSLRCGQIVLIRANDNVLMLHRLVARRGAAVRTRGDAHLRNDGWLPATTVLGRVTAVKRGTRDLTGGLRFGRLWVWGGRAWNGLRWVLCTLWGRARGHRCRGAGVRRH